VKRVFKAVEDMSGSLVDNIQIHFLLSQSLAQSVTQFPSPYFISRSSVD